MTLQAVVFDLFGTLVEYKHERLDQDYRQTYRLVAEAAPAVTYEEFLACWGRVFSDWDVRSRQTGREFSMQQVSASYLESVGVRDTSLIEPLSLAYINEWSAAVSPVNGVSSLLASMSRHYKLALITNTHYSPMVHRILDDMAITNLFEVITTSVDFGQPKPEPAIFEYSLSQLEVPPGEAVYVGDNFVADYQGSQAVGMRSILIGSSARVPRLHQAPSVLDLPRLI